MIVILYTFTWNLNAVDLQSLAAHSEDYNVDLVSDIFVLSLWISIKDLFAFLKNCMCFHL